MSATHESVVELHGAVASLAGLVTVEGAPPANARVTLRRPGARGRGSTCTTDVDGRYLISCLARGLYEVFVHARGAAVRPLTTVELHAGQQRLPLDLDAADVPSEVDARGEAPRA